MLRYSLLNYLLFLIVLVAVLRLKDWKTVVILISVLSISYLIAILLAVISSASFNLVSLKLLILFTIFSLAVTKIFTFKSRYIKIKKEYIVLIITALFGFYNGLGSSINFILEIGALTNNTIPVLEVFLGFSIAVCSIALLLVTANTIFFNYVKVDKFKWLTGLSVIIICVTATILSKQILY